MGDSNKCHDFKPGDTILVDTSKIKDFDPRNLNVNRWEWYANFCRESKTGELTPEGWDIVETVPKLYTFICEHSPQEGHGVIVELSQYRPVTHVMVHLDKFRKATLEEC